MSWVDTDLRQEPGACLTASWAAPPQMLLQAGLLDLLCRPLHALQAHM